MAARRRHSGTGSVTQLRDGRWQARLWLENADGKRTRHALYAKTRSEAEGRLIEALGQRRRGTLIAGRGPTLAGHCESWLAATTMRLRPRTREKYRQYLQAHLLPTLGEIPLARLDVAHVNRLLSAKLDSGLAPATVAGFRTVLRASLAAALRQDLVHRNVAALAEPVRIPFQERPILTPQDARRLLAAADADQDGPLWTLALTTGAREGELLGLRWSDYEAERHVLRIARTLQRFGGDWHLLEPKTTRSRRSIALSPLAVAALDQQLALQAALRIAAGHRWQDTWDGLMFTTATGSPRLGPSVARRFRKRLRALGLPAIRFHDLRHTAASILADAGVPPKAVGDYLGDSTVTTMKIYTHSLPDSARRAAEVLTATLTDPPLSS